MKKIILTLLLSFGLCITSCSNTDSDIDKLDSLCDDYIENINRGRLHDAKTIEKKMEKYWDKMNELNREEKLTEEEKERLDEIETRMFHAKYSN